MSASARETRAAALLPCRDCGYLDGDESVEPVEWIEPGLCSRCDPDRRLADERPDVD